ncbi:hypothetical protein GH714_039698 [Hevea brasiliensis]|uniref:Uncharacterized protein n=1 Tax=Hevea brasiliensis TaxID=3981 RepID=A0A6A6KEY1_HEVBR|nr:hypothetical protein GH714_039698 [Hevea brasiliensis]
MSQEEETQKCSNSNNSGGGCGVNIGNIVSVQGHGNMPKIWNSCDFNLEKETSCGVDPGLAFRSRLNLPFESNSTWPLPSLMQGAQYPPPPMVNVSSTSSSSSLQNLHMELPSNQSCYGNYTPVWPEEEKLS